MIAVSSCASTAAKNVGSKVVNLLAVLVSDDGPSSGTGISSQHYAILHIFWLIHCPFTIFEAPTVHRSKNFNLP